MAKNVGWVKIFRKLIDNRMYFSEPFDKTHAWIDLIMIADSSGTISTNIKQLANRWKWSEGKVRRYLAKLSEEDMVRTDGSHGGVSNGTTIDIVKYSDYQCGRRTDGSSNGRTDDTSEWGRGDLYNIYITRKEEEKNTPNILTDITPTGGDEAPKKRKSEPFKIPTIEEVEAYCKERNNGVDATYWWNYYNARGWEYSKGKPMKNWKSAVITWERNNRASEPKKKQPVKQENVPGFNEIFGVGG